VLAVLACSSVAAGALVVGRQPLIGLSGNLISSGDALQLIVFAWLVVLPPVLAFASIGVLLSVVSRNSLVGILGAAAIGLIMQFAGMIDGAQPLQVALLGTHFLAWHGLFAAPQFTKPIAQDLVVSVVYLAACGTASWLVLRRRDVAVG
jgi:ABC-2 type transport system permease protein